MGLSSVGAYGSQGGYSAINFLFMYTCGAFLYKFDRNEANKKKLVVSLLIITILLVGWAYFNDAIGVFKVQSAWMYSNPLVIILAIVLFKLFNSINIGYSKIINELAKASFTVFLLQNYFLTKLNIKEFVQNNCFIMLGHILFSIVFIYLISYILFKIYNIFIEKVVILICNKITFINKDIYNNCFDGLN